ncbi:hypothetical protein FAES_4856 [Fibrella aestuarina BUZ 2]|uniref:Outer membrane protein beta-barrel domain-containing protein n=1 Tax=Fibrella aestuarina BUZ 2 TaxID=1166018 RepID=I0KFF2_9BACT|nr:outer membrane beta-barrel protein [Fibrella aestuarina]CCH02855.1 hypothetical protein FAES_4856 [Fibrella aestuarina BUZ 2]
MRQLLLALLLLPVSLLAQKTSPRIGTVQGVVLDSATRKPLLEANVSLLSARDSSFVQVQSTGGDGDFRLHNIAAGTYRVLVTFVGYESKAVRVTITADRPDVALGTLLLQPQTQTLGEVAVKAERAPVSVKGDTLEFNAGSFKTQPNAQVEDLIRKLPGMEVDRDGNVKAQGQDVKRVLVDGKPFFGNDPKMATRNLPADMVERVQVFDRQSDQSQFSGVDDGERDRTINIVTKRDRRRGVFGQNAAGYGADEANDPRYQVRLGVNRFNNGQQLSAIGQFNNINQQGFTGEGLSTGGGQFGGGGQGGNGGGGGGRQTITNTGGGSSSGSNGLGPTGITRALAGGLNFSDALGTKVDLSSSYFLNQTNTRNLQTNFRETTIPGRNGGAPTVNLTNSHNESDNTYTSHRFNVQLNWRLDSMNSLRVIPNLTYSPNVSNSANNSRTTDAAGNLLNSSVGTFRNEGRNLSGTNVLLWMHKFKRRGRTFSANLATTINDQNSTGLNQSRNEFARSTDVGSLTSVPGSSTVTPGTSGTGPFATNINQQNRQITDAITNNVTLSYTEPLSLAKTLEFRYSLSSSNNESDRRVDDFNEATGQYDRVNTNLTNRFNNLFLTNRAGISYQFRRVKYQYTLGFDAQEASLQSDNLSKDTRISKSFFNMLPNARFQYNLGRNRNFTADYRTRVNAPSVTQLQPVIDNSNPLYIRQGNPELRPEYTHSLNLNYRTFNQSTFQNFVASVSLTNTYNRIVNATTISPAGAQIIQPVNADGFYSFFGFVSYGKPATWGGQRVNINLTTNINGSRGISYVNQLLNRSLTVGFGQGLNLNTNLNEKTDLLLSGNVTYSIANYSAQPQQNARYLTTTGNFRGFHRFGQRFFAQTDAYFIANAGRAAGYNQQFVLLNASVGQYLFRNKQGEWRLTGYDLLNQNRSITRNTSETYVEDTQSLVLRRYVMLTFAYTIRYFAPMRAN